MSRELEAQMYESIGEELAEFFQLDKNSIGRYDTSWGDKTLQGLGRSVERVIQKEYTKMSAKIKNADIDTSLSPQSDDGQHDPSPKWYIMDWAGNEKFIGEEFTSESKAIARVHEYILDENPGMKYDDDDFYETLGEYQFKQRKRSS